MPPLIKHSKMTNKRSTLVFLLLLGHVIAAEEDGERIGVHAPLITNGQRAKEGQFPWQAAVYAETGSGTAFCGGSLIAESWVLTAAHCVHKMKNFTVVLGAHRLPDGAEGSRQVFRVRASDGHAHPAWSAFTLRHDIALLRLPTPAKLDGRVSVIELATRSHGDAAGALGTVSGWGLQSDKDDSVAEYLQFVRQKIISNSLCNLFYAFRIRSTHMCMSGVAGKSTCQGDSGGPLIVRDPNSQSRFRQVGLVSFGLALGCEVGWPAVFTRLSSYSDFLTEHTGLDLQ